MRNQGAFKRSLVLAIALRKGAKPKFISNFCRMVEKVRGREALNASKPSQSPPTINAGMQTCHTSPWASIDRNAVQQNHYCSIARSLNRVVKQNDKELRMWELPGDKHVADFIVGMNPELSAVFRFVFVSSNARRADRFAAFSKFGRDEAPGSAKFREAHYDNQANPGSASRPPPNSRRKLTWP